MKQEEGPLTDFEAILKIITNRKGVITFRRQAMFLLQSRIEPAVFFLRPFRAALRGQIHKSLQGPSSVRFFMREQQNTATAAY